MTIAAVTPAGIPPDGAAAAVDAGGALLVVEAGAGVVDVELEPPEQPPIATAAATSRAGRTKEL